MSEFLMVDLRDDERGVRFEQILLLSVEIGEFSDRLPSLNGHDVEIFVVVGVLRNVFESES